MFVCVFEVGTAYLFLINQRREEMVFVSQLEPDKELLPLHMTINTILGVYFCIDTPLLFCFADGERLQFPGLGLSGVFRLSRGLLRHPIVGQHLWQEEAELEGGLCVCGGKSHHFRHDDVDCERHFGCPVVPRLSQ